MPCVDVTIQALKTFNNDCGIDTLWLLIEAMDVLTLDNNWIKLRVSLNILFVCLFPIVEIMNGNILSLFMCS